MNEIASGRGWRGRWSWPGATAGARLRHAAGSRANVPSARGSPPLSYGKTILPRGNAPLPCDKAILPWGDAPLSRGNATLPCDNAVLSCANAVLSCANTILPRDNMTLARGKMILSQDNGILPDANRPFSRRIGPGKRHNVPFASFKPPKCARPSGETRSNRYGPG